MTLINPFPLPTKPSQNRVSWRRESVVETTLTTNKWTSAPRADIPWWFVVFDHIGSSSAEPTTRSQSSCPWACGVLTYLHLSLLLPTSLALRTIGSASCMNHILTSPQTDFGIILSTTVYQHSDDFHTRSAGDLVFDPYHGVGHPLYCSSELKEAQNMSFGTPQHQSPPKNKAPKHPNPWASDFRL